jgi:Uncharacterized conserved protein
MTSSALTSKELELHVLHQVGGEQGGQGNQNDTNSNIADMSVATAAASTTTTTTTRYSSANSDANANANNNAHLTTHTNCIVTINTADIGNQSTSSSHKNKGRAARRRKAKARSIHMALQALLNGETLEEVKQQQQQQQPSNDQDGSSHFSLPSDRCLPSIGVLQRRQENHVEFEKDGPILVSQLGYMPGNAVGVVGRCKDLETLYPCLYKMLKIVDEQQQSSFMGAMKGATLQPNNKDNLSPPTVLQLYPLALRSVFVGGKAQGRKFKSRKRGRHDDILMTSHSTEQAPSTQQTQPQTQLEEPFPTIYWLTHPFLKTLVSQLEIGSTNNVTEMQRRLKTSNDYLSCMKLAHECYAKQRWDLLTDQDRDRISQQSQDMSCKDKWIVEAIGSKRGVAGIRKFDTVKCLHTHAAHYLAYLGNVLPDMKENLVGKWVLQSLEEVARDMNNDTGT